MNNIKAKHVTPNLSNPIASFFIILVMLAVGLICSALGFWAMQPVKDGGLGINKLIVLAVLMNVTLLALFLVPAGAQYKENLHRQYAIFKNKHTWAMTVIYTMTFGSFIGFSAALALAMQVIFGFKHVMIDGAMTHTLVNPEAPSVFMYAWIAPFIGAVVRPLGGSLADKYGGALITQIISGIMVICALGVAFYMKAAYNSATPEVFFIPFLLVFLVLFFAAGIGNGSTFRTIAVVFDKEQAGPTLGWTSAVAAYGAFYIPQVFGEQIKAGTPEIALYGFAIFYAVCMAINYWFYLKPNAYVQNP
ncbi:MAG: MFS transporter NNP family nitrate/nitrite transporter [Hyphomonadaceae bacterium]|nr:MAG: MFS transporter NNP family nitrate/nitrite transporter [Hyphomonadaceae bacterium]